MKYVVIVVLVFVVGAVFAWRYFQPDLTSVSPTYTAEESVVTKNYPRTEVIAENLSIPWEVLFLPDGELLITERPGNVVLLKQGVSIPISGVRHVGEGGLLGAALHPDFESNNYVYLYQTTEADNGLINRVDRYVLDGTDLLFDRTIVDSIPGARYHDGGRIAFGPDGYLYVTLGDAVDEEAAQNTENLAGSILRFTAEGEIPDTNPFNNPIYSYGHRNPQGLTWDDSGNLWSSEHGRSGVRSGYDEINLINIGNNYGWPDIEGNETEVGMESPIRHSGADITWAPGDLAYHNGSLYMPGLRGRTLYKADLEGTEIVAWNEYFVGEYGRLRSVVVGKDNLLYLTTSNRDGRGDFEESDDLIIRVNPELLDQIDRN